MGTLSTVQQEQLKAIGTYLSQIRQEQKQSLEEISTKTYIPLRLLKAIEAGQEKPLPEPVFVQGFIRRYADALGLDGIDLSQRFPVQITPLPVASGATSNREMKVENAVEPHYRYSPVDEQPAFSQSPAVQRSLPFLPYIVAAGLLVLGGIALGIVHSISSKPPESASESDVVLPKQPAASVSPAPVSPAPVSSASPSVPSSSSASSKPSATPKPVASASPSPVKSPATTASPSSLSASKPAATSGPIQVEMNLTDRSWVQVTVDGEVKTEGNLPKGTRQSWSGQKEVTIVAGNAGAVLVSRNGEAAKPMGSLGDVSERTFK